MVSLLVSVGPITVVHILVSQDRDVRSSVSPVVGRCRAECGPATVCVCAERVVPCGGLEVSQVTR